MTVWVKVRQVAGPHPRVEKETSLNGRDTVQRRAWGGEELVATVVANISAPGTCFMEDNFL